MAQAEKRGFGSMDENKQREIASKGGKASHEGSNKSTNKSNSRGGSSEQRREAGKHIHKNS